MWKKNHSDDPSAGPEPDPAEKRDEERESRREFIREQIVRPPLTPGQVLFRAAFLAGGAILFGAVAAVAYAVVKPAAEARFDPKNAAESTIAFSEDETASDLSPEESRAEETQESEEQAREIDEAVSRALADTDHTAENLRNGIRALEDTADGLDGGIVTVAAGTQQKDMFGNPVETTGTSAGIIIASTDQEALALCCSKSVPGAESVQVTLADGTTTDAAVRQTDSLLGLTVLAIPTTNLSSDQKAALTVVPMGNSYVARRGDLLIAVGAPSGHIHSVAYGVLSRIDAQVSMPDCTAMVMYTGCDSSSAGTYFVNLDGELVGWASNDESEDTSMVSVLGVSRFKKLLTSLTNGSEIPYFGARFQDVTVHMTESGIPRGAYITEVVADSPVYASGIQNGDIIVQYGERTISSANALEESIAASRPGETVRVRVMRAGAAGYEPVDFTVAIRKR